MFSIEYSFNNCDILLCYSISGEPDYSEQQILLHNGQTQTVCVTTVFET